MAAYTDPNTTERFAELILAPAEGDDDAPMIVEATDAASDGYLVPRGESLIVTDEDGERYMITVRRISY